ncbi:hypothetical protein [Halarchaeum nitratireducens]|uniref:DUF8060 domain-containing protein n=1 Tax=Halarchaeum nitratireducens TaxID=489913 RepID=A0A830GCS0_9EURY|nr:MULTISPECIES: hypothetical protein [Halarchaeum]MBP2250780.1 hypothetical protein [Halarchaeum solikamskense]GGN18848.1 hypothetical protein GCM10009021_19930 [Halarchaeum nitratireducens]
MSDDEHPTTDEATDTEETMDTNENAAADGERDGENARTEDDGVALRRGARVLGIAIAGLVALVACVSLYGAVGTLIAQWVAPRYQPLYEAGFDLAVLLLAAAVVARLARGTEAF